jgi:hypothetical protein
MAITHAQFLGQHRKTEESSGLPSSKQHALDAVFHYEYAFPSSPSLLN